MASILAYFNHRLLCGFFFPIDGTNNRYEFCCDLINETLHCNGNERSMKFATFIETIWRGKKYTHTCDRFSCYSNIATIPPSVFIIDLLQCFNWERCWFWFELHQLERRRRKSSWMEEKNTFIRDVIGANNINIISKLSYSEKKKSLLQQIVRMYEAIAITHS